MKLRHIFTTVASTIALGLSLSACSGSESESGAESGAGTGGQSGTETGAPETGAGSGADTETGSGVSPYDCVDPDFGASPLAGPGYNPEQGLLGDPQESYVAHSTQLLVPEDRREVFGVLVEPVVAQLDKLTLEDGLVAYSLGGDPKCGFSRTLGIWRDTESMYKFVFSGAHSEVMSETLDVSVTGKVTHWDIAPEELAGVWDEAKVRLDAVEPSPIYD